MGRNVRPLNEQVETDHGRGHLNPLWVEMLMGYPLFMLGLFRPGPGPGPDWEGEDALAIYGDDLPPVKIRC
jgi:hypothetical protein